MPKNVKHRWDPEWIQRLLYVVARLRPPLDFGDEWERVAECFNYRIASTKQWRGDQLHSKLKQLVNSKPTGAAGGHSSIQERARRIHSIIENLWNTGAITRGDDAFLDSQSIPQNRISSRMIRDSRREFDEERDQIFESSSEDDDDDERVFDSDKSNDDDDDDDDDRLATTTTVANSRSTTAARSVAVVRNTRNTRNTRSTAAARSVAVAVVPNSPRSTAAARSVAVAVVPNTDTRKRKKTENFLPNEIQSMFEIVEECGLEPRHWDGGVLKKFHTTAMKIARTRSKTLEADKNTKGITSKEAKEKSKHDRYVCGPITRKVESLHRKFASIRQDISRDGNIEDNRAVFVGTLKSRVVGCGTSKKTEEIPTGHRAQKETNILSEVVGFLRRKEQRKRESPNRSKRRKIHEAITQIDALGTGATTGLKQHRTALINLFSKSVVGLLSEFDD